MTTPCFIDGNCGYSIIPPSEWMIIPQIFFLVVVLSISGVGIGFWIKSRLRKRQIIQNNKPNPTSD